MHVLEEIQNLTHHMNIKEDKTTKDNNEISVNYVMTGKWWNQCSCWQHFCIQSLQEKRPIMTVHYIPNWKEGRKKYHKMSKCAFFARKHGVFGFH